MEENNKLSEKLSGLFDEIYFSLKEDLDEINDNIEQYHVLIDDNPDGKALFGSLYNDSLKIKGQIRERQLKFLNSFKERVSKLENDALKNNTGSETEEGVDHTGLSQILKEMAKSGDITKKKYEVPKTMDEGHTEELEIDKPNTDEDDDE